VGKGRREAIVKDLLDLVGMGAFRHGKAHKLSGGETQRVAIAQALACSPEVILLDEPTANVDVENQAIIERIMRDINETMGISVIFTTHDIVQASRVAEETMFLFEGKAARSIHENIFSGSIEKDKEGLTFFVIQNQWKLRVPTAESDRTRLSIDPSQVTIASSPSSGENTFKGKLIQVTDQQRRVRLLVDVGIPLSLLVDKDVFARLPLEIGGEVWISCPVESIQVF
jgi:tungstate transport system ATP-binding protein